ncbi:MAG: 1-hydroxycarotenoid 3,4-desaturase CrtD [Salibacteraceae bacterium]
MKKVAVIGSGVGGIASALRLKAKGYYVDVFEAKDFLGGKLAELQLGEYRFDMGPSLLTLPNLIEELFDLFDEKCEDHFQYDRLDPICKYFWDDGTELLAYSNIEKFALEAAEVFKIESSEITEYLSGVKKRYQLAGPPFIEKSLHKKSTWLSSELIKAVAQLSKLHVFSTLNELNEKHFSEPKLVQLFNRYATYNGSSPYLTPGIMSVIPYLEYYLGAYFPKNGMISIPLSLVELGKRNGVNFHINSYVSEIIIKKGKASGIEVNGNKLNYDLVVSDMDIYPTYKNLLPNEKTPKSILSQARSSSGLVLYLGINREFDNLNIHNIFFSDNYKEEFNCIFNKDEVYFDPTVYVHISNKASGIDCPKGKENWFIMISTCSHNGKMESDKWIKKQRDNIINKLNKRLGIDLNDFIEEESYLTPYMIEDRTYSHKGSLYGTASNSMLSGLLRHPNFSQKIKDLYFCGGSVHPGGGIPLCLSSAKIIDSLTPNATA